MKTAANNVQKSGGPALRAWAVGLVLTAWAGASWSHHSFAMFDKEKHVKVTGVVTEFQWTNPHTYIELDASEPGGAKKHFTIECSSISILRHVGWKPTDLKAGDTITIELFPLRDGRPGGLMNKVTLPDGRSLGNANDE